VPLFRPCLTLSKPLLLQLIVIWPWKPTSPIWYGHLLLNCVALVPSVIFCTQRSEKLFSLPSAFTPWLLEFPPVWLSSVSLKQAINCSKQLYSPCPKNSPNWWHLSSPCLSPLAAHWFTNTVRIAPVCYVCLNRCWLLVTEPVTNDVSHTEWRHLQQPELPPATPSDVSLYTEWLRSLHRMTSSATWGEVHRNFPHQSLLGSRYLYEMQGMSTGTGPQQW